MQGPNEILSKEFRADGALTQHRAGKKGTNEDDIAMASAVTDDLMGVIQHDAADNERVRLMLMGISKIEYGGNVTQGMRLTVDAQGRAVEATRHDHPTDGTNPANQVSTIGIAMADGVSGDIGTVFLDPSFA